MNLQRKHILILTPAPDARGGVSNYYQTIKGYFNLNVDYLYRGARQWPYHASFFIEFFRILIDLINYCFIVYRRHYTLIVVNTGMGYSSIRRDSIYVSIALRHKIKVVVFYHGWDYNAIDVIRKKYWKLFKSTFLQADSSLVLSSTFKNELIEWGYNKPVYVETTVVDNRLIHDTDFDDIISNPNLMFIPKLLFLARTEKAKGIYEAIDAYSIIKNKYPFSSFTIVGDGFELENITKYVTSKDIKDVHIAGFLSGEEKRQAFLNANLFVFPSYTEGMPTSVLEAMTFGLPIVATPVGGLVDILEDGVTGYFVKQKDVPSIVDACCKIIENNGLRQSMVAHNMRMAREKFTSDKVAERLETIFNSII